MYAHDFCNIKVRKNQNQFSCIAHNFFDMFFLIKGITLSVWGTRDVNTGGTGLTNINFASISNQVEFIDAMKYFLNSLGQRASTLDVVEKKTRWKTNSSIFKPTQLFLAVTKKSGSRHNH